MFWSTAIGADHLSGAACAASGRASNTTASNIPSFRPVLIARMLGFPQ